MDNDAWGSINFESQQSEISSEVLKDNSQVEEKPKAVANSAKVTKEKEEKKYEKELREAKEELKETKEKLAKLKQTALKDRTDEQKKQFKILSKTLQENKYRLAKARQEYDRVKNSRSVRQQRKKLVEGKQQAIIKILEAEGIGTENEIKTLITIKRISKMYGVKDAKHLKEILEYISKNEPQILY